MRKTNTGYEEEVVFDYFPRLHLQLIQRTDKETTSATPPTQDPVTASVTPSTQTLIAPTSKQMELTSSI